MILDDEAIILMGLEGAARKLGLSGAHRHVDGRSDPAGNRPDPLPDLIVADYRLADGRTGPDVIEAIRGIAGPDVPGIVLTGDTAPELIDWVKGARASASCTSRSPPTTFAS